MVRVRVRERKAQSTAVSYGLVGLRLWRWLWRRWYLDPGLGLGFVYDFPKLEGLRAFPSGP